ncbi:hypothetical protein [Laspinema olomoucense]|uniref:Uncharacterized protein n=1 Tax=Laspinema olomoucense D3b TaxID=2953688 RepID=A0ABT2NFC4_9CYAN|nr:MULTISPECIES: hypothetical protein [unclassified Laspinema]MCT7981401.1 hypothetical protein [Laspinema sp. D3b]MCT7989712.1 hypothetical protein [Laspinema sp. D3a]MCT7994024.1 hypothetical protein [Laspinema sp. D3c]
MYFALVIAGRSLSPLGIDTLGVLSFFVPTTGTGALHPEKESSQAIASPT